MEKDTKISKMMIRWDKELYDLLKVDVLTLAEVMPALDKHLIKIN